MSVPVLTIPVESTVNEVAEIFLSEKVSSLLVTEEGFPVGIVTTDDLIRVLLNQTQEQAKHLSLTDEIKVRWAQTPFATLAGGLSNSGV
jgi:CBS domain-containing protein